MYRITETRVMMKFANMVQKNIFRPVRTYPMKKQCLMLINLTTKDLFTF